MLDQVLSFYYAFSLPKSCTSSFFFKLSFLTLGHIARLLIKNLKKVGP